MCEKKNGIAALVTMLKHHSVITFFAKEPVYPGKYITIPKNAIITDIEITHSRVIHQNVPTRFLKQEKEHSFPWFLRERVEFNVQINVDYS